MALWGIEFPIAPIREWRMWPPFLAFVSCQFVLLIVHSVAHDALVGVTVFLSCVSCVSCIIWRRLRVLLANFLSQCFLFFVLLVCAVTGASSMAGLHENKPYMALVVIQFLAFSLGLAACGNLVYRFKTKAPIIPVTSAVRKPPIEFCEREVRLTSSHQSLDSNGADSGLISTLFGLISSKRPSFCASQCHSDADAKTASSTQASRGYASDSEKNDSASLTDRSAVEGKCNSNSIRVTDGRESDWFLTQSFRHDQEKEQLYQDALRSFAESSLPGPCQAPSHMEVSPDSAQVPACALSSLAPCLNASLAGTDEAPSSSALSEERDLHRASGESIVVFSATDEKGVFYVRTTSVSPVPSPTNVDSEASSFDLSPQTMDGDCHHTNKTTEPEPLSMEAAGSPAGPKRYRVGAYSCDDYAYRQTSDGEPPATYIVQLTDSDCSEFSSAVAHGSSVAPASGVANQLNPPSPLQSAWKTLKRKSRKSLQNAIQYLSSSSEAQSDECHIAKPVPVHGNSGEEYCHTPPGARTERSRKAPTGQRREVSSTSGVPTSMGVGPSHPNSQRGMQSPLTTPSGEEVDLSASVGAPTGAHEETKAGPSGDVQTLPDTDSGDAPVKSRGTATGAEAQITSGGYKLASNACPSWKSRDIFPGLRSDDSLKQDDDSGEVPKDSRAACTGDWVSDSSNTGWGPAEKQARSLPGNTKYSPPSFVGDAAKNQAEWPEGDISGDDGSVNLSLSSSEADFQP
ncbi:putative proteophosphoglycan protein ppg4 [Toxoplasma gondii GAB2-2007-GAL-DOM2]|uniref:Proteophosphoglycan protein ppg4 n=8 Tax=Toxoplasma gondii TaxID=5811 RepID=S7W314_TOXGG|nr:hypothetical protein TGGT1_205370 [Toxoplasma gondii GT1]ESS33228.1 putative proteophosphoglycan protein ppg4 [Toxoplasma gondii VEG]KAF4642690.1 hypothetical protein TGRH88_034160 [Toxoplasma gondii]KFG33666.1 putative proteophosphoglycan protein ppg4 [Toxoplasma gondii p89]KFG36802.1 putative proteophosphoglycan protein ppg4 [Toxoplasma gondii FOU]KFG38231.1 putative proteophosphoglycan protein ppg4 [Toxoplasma gondii GAB2-2007-GAL-DOM2]KFH07573.1 putative proteophosphoglycan protein ppg